MDLKSVSVLGGLLTLLENQIARYVDGWLGELSCPSLRIIVVCAWGESIARVLRLTLCSMGWRTHMITCAA